MAPKVLFPRTQKINLSPIKQIELLASKIPDVVSLAQGIPSFDTPEVIKKATIKALNKGLVAKYSLTYGLPELRETIEEKLAQEGMYYDFENEIVVTAGSIEAITASLITIIDGKKDEILLFSPSYTSYAEAVKVAGGKPVFVNLDEKNGWSIDFDNLTKKITANTAGILFANPNNPTGTIFKKEELLKIAELAEKKKFYIITDEVYKDFLYTVDGESEPFFSLAQIPELRKRVIRVFSLSKAYAMTGWRIGFVHSDVEIISEIVKVHDAMVTCAPVISQYAAIAALDFAEKDIEYFRNEYTRRRDVTMAHLDELSEFFSYQKPNGAYFVFPKLLPKRDSWEFARELLEKAHVAVVPGAAFGPNGEGHIRISFGRTEKDIDRAFGRIKKYFKKQA
ncbi:MAG: Aromatic amino acid aminotransferase [Candidatus Wolfebacteria bacterium GW2011_GWC2_39_22]|uniref:Aminotransferase n=1 Tax=Candidatus Wolfebacteria bacterium GW2011_GWC2_39_22 TaxID=1619013 RepID=A0A0G0QP33_9BACT|nr:MAG: Aromatic amino acid aminotransferase [Candidatus Wolfebacteria bacterium GW2011_GWC2_39_22]HBI25229.1 aminotransferase [Candidatus Wolfebacteria bacterium]